MLASILYAVAIVKACHPFSIKSTSLIHSSILDAIPRISEVVGRDLALLILVPLYSTKDLSVELMVGQ